MKFLKFYKESISNALLYGYSEKYNISPKVMELIVSRGYKTGKQIEKFLFPSKSDFHNPYLLFGMKQTVDRIKQAVENKEKVLIFGDYDVDGVSASAIMLKMFGKLGLRVNCYLPNRYIDGYGLTNQVIDKIKGLYNPSLIITVDCGISCKAEVEYAKSLGIEIYVTDHHEIPEELPQTVIINAKLPNQKYPFSQLCGTGVAFKIAQAILGEEADEFLPIAALATIADIVPLTDENRTIVKLGMDNIQKLPLGVRSLIKELKLNINEITATDIAFKLAPKINASGRMGDAKDSLYLYMESNPIVIKKLINEIIGYNSERQVLCNKVYDDCKKMLANVNISNHRAIVLYDNSWDHGILGIVCARLLEEYHRPVFLFSEDEGKLKGSARSLADINVHNLLTNMQDILETFGGHSVAAGLSLQLDKFEEFKNRVEKYIFENISDKAFVPIHYYDTELKFEEITPKFLSDLTYLEPFGCENQQPHFLLDIDDNFISPMKNCPQHANIIIGKKLSLVRFNYVKDYYKLKFGKNKKAVFEFQFSKLKKQNIKGLLKELDYELDYESKTKSNLEAFVLNQLCYQDLKSEPKFKTLDEQSLLKLISELELSSFGTAFVFYNLQNCKNFTQKYNIENFYEYGIGEEIKSTGFNSIIVTPENLDWTKNYNRIVFMDNILDKGFISKINQISTAEVYIFDNNIKNDIFSKINIQRENFAKVYNSLKKVNNVNFANLQLVYNKVLQEKINFYDFYSALLVFNDLQLLSIEKTGDIKITIKNDKKVQLTNSKIYNFINFIKNVQNR